MTNGEIDTTLARQLINDTPDEFTDWLDFGGGFVAVGWCYDGGGVVLYSNGVDHSEAYHGNGAFVSLRAEEMAQAEAEHVKKSGCFGLVEYDASHIPLFEVDHDERTITTTEAYR